jgi:transcriptional regulator with XRE-family HTH domain
MSAELLKYTGERIRHYRKARRLTIDELATKIHKSKASISKYERGQISLDISTLFDISKALSIDPILLLNYPKEKQARLPKNRYPFGNADKLYMYNMMGHKVYKSAIHMWESKSNSETMANLYYMVKDFDEIEKCECFYEGNMHSYDNILCYTFQNSMSHVENLLLNFFLPMRKFSSLTGLASGLGANTLLPTCSMVLLSPKPLVENEQLKKRLSIPQDTVKNIKKSNLLTLYPNTDH